MHDVHYNPVDDEIVVPNPFANAILTFRGGANGQEAPIRTIQGPNTELGGPDRLAIDVVHREIFVPNREWPNGSAVAVYPLDGSGDVRPTRILGGPDTKLGRNDPSVAIDPLHNLMVVSNREAKSILVFDRNASGNTKPLRVIRGPNTLIGNINGLVVYPEGKLVMLAIPGHGIGMWSLDDDGDVPPKWAVTGSQTTLKAPFAVALNPKDKEIYVTDMGLNGLVVFSTPEVFEPATSGTAPMNRR